MKKIMRWVPPDNAHPSNMDVKGEGEFVLYTDHVAALAVRDQSWRDRIEKLAAEWAHTGTLAPASGGHAEDEYMRGDCEAYGDAAESLRALLKEVDQGE